jgi:hypothetical protein
MEITKEQLKKISEESFFEWYKTWIEIMMEQTQQLWNQNKSGYVLWKMKEEMK